MYISNSLVYITLIAAAFAAPAERDRQSPSPPRCYTRVGSIHVARPTTKLTTTSKSCTSTITTTSTSTIVPASLTSTVTTTVVTTETAPTSTSTATTTVSSLTSATTMTTSTSTTTTTSTLSTVSTSTVAAPAGFIPIQISLPGTTYQGSGGPDPFQKRGFQLGAYLDLSLTNGKGRVPKRSYAQDVTCVSQASSSRCTTVTSTKITTITAPTGTTTVTSTIAETTTVFPGATTTVTTTTISTTTATETASRVTTSTETTTSFTSSTTVYAASTNNLADRYNGDGVYYFEGTDSIDVMSNISTAYDCCVLSFTSPTTYGAWTYDAVTNPDLFAVAGNCHLGSNNVCVSGTQSNLYSLHTLNPPTGLMGNSACGMANFGRPY